jgi:hypothetical protein
MGPLWVSAASQYLKESITPPSDCPVHALKIASPSGCSMLFFTHCQGASASRLSPLTESTHKKSMIQKITVVACVSLMTGLAFASNSPTTQATFEKVDTNADGVITFEEFQGKITQRDQRLDKNSDGIITEQEWPNKAVFKKFDANGDGKITTEESQAKTKAAFEVSDKNKDGTLDRTEFKP